MSIQTGNIDLRSYKAVTYHGICSTSAETTAKTVICANFELTAGATVECYCSTANTAAVPTLNVNGTGAKPIWINGVVASASNPCKWKAGDTVTFTYNTTDASTGVYRASLPVENYITADSTGIKIHDATNTTNYQHQTSSGTAVFVGGNKRTAITSTGLEVFDTDGSTSLANFGTSARVGATSGGNVVIDSDSVDINNGSNLLMSLTASTNVSNLWLANPSSATTAYDRISANRSTGALGIAAMHKTGTPAIALQASSNNYVTEVKVQSASSSATSGTIFSISRAGRDYMRVDLDGDIYTYGGIKTGDVTTANYVMATPNGSTGAAMLRALVAADIPNISATKITTDTLDAARIPSLAASKIGSGTLATARGGTGADGSSVAINRVLASPSSGSAGAVSYRALVAADLPTVPVAKGGTGSTTAANALKNIMGGKTILYDDSNGDTGQINLSQTSANFNHMRIYYGSTDGYSSVDVYSPNGKKVSLTHIYTTGNSTWPYQLGFNIVTISAEKITRTTGGYVNFGSSAVSSGSQTTVLKIFRVEAWNE